MANKVYQLTEASRTWSDAGTTSDELLDLGGLAADAVKCGSFHDLGVSPRSEWYQVVFKVTGFTTSPIIGETVLLYFTESNSTTGFDGMPTTDPTTTAEGTVTKDQLRNLGIPVVILSVISTALGDDLQARAKVRFTSRYVAPVSHNNTSKILQSSGDAHMVTITPIPDQIQ